jgi:hypothetical protein
MVSRSSTVCSHGPTLAPAPTRRIARFQLARCPPNFINEPLGSNVADKVTGERIFNVWRTENISAPEGTFTTWDWEPWRSDGTEAPYKNQSGIESTKEE